MIFSNNQQLGQIKSSESKEYIRFRHTIKWQQNERRVRYLLNIDPDKIPEVGPKILQETILLPYVYYVKMSLTKIYATQRLDNIIIYLKSVDGNDKNDLEHILRSYRQHTRLGHPAMVEPLDTEIQGIAFADQTKAHVESRGWGRTRIRHIADVMWEFKQRGEEILFENLLPEVQQRFSENGIDPDNPYRDLSSTSGDAQG
jgi:hypothetical protein